LQLDAAAGKRASRSVRDARATPVSGNKPLYARCDDSVTGRTKYRNTRHRHVVCRPRWILLVLVNSNFNIAMRAASVRVGDANEVHADGLTACQAQQGWEDFNCRSGANRFILVCSGAEVDWLGQYSKPPQRVVLEWLSPEQTTSIGMRICLDTASPPRGSTLKFELHAEHLFRRQ
jgi:hypothetical protein